ncbi:MAG: hypothetical protein QUV35_07475 [Hydrogenophaga sp.]|uniref:helix-turn-helix transcriptional regulator n=1 Tax=Hydrogenophaga sp. TaxID=1904254 RepID=UPI002618738C|nr:hypothetical protein [Hydrogenophaga sp.]MDM7942453.1 hypothetical protein [Hydrogenophaga sp.]
MTELNAQPGTRYLSIPRLCDKLSRRKTWVYDLLQQDPTFPRPIRINNRSLFDEQAVDAWVKSKVDQAVGSAA